MKKLIMCLMLGIFLISMASASCPDGDDCITGSSGIVLNEGIEIYQTCNNCTYCTFTKVKYPNKTVFLSNLSATQDDTYFSYNILGGNNSEIGEYEYCYDCGNAVEKETGCLHYLVTPTGKQFTMQNSISYLGFILIILFTFFLTMYGAGRIEWKNKTSNEGKILTINNFRYVKILLYTLAYFELMFLFGLSYKVCREADIEGFAQFFNFIYQFFLHFIYPLMIGLIIIIFVIWISNKKLSERLKLGLGK